MWCNWRYALERLLSGGLNKRKTPSQRGEKQGQEFGANGDLCCRSSGKNKSLMQGILMTQECKT